uniref:(northern house mosquito) hypothetical protein n=1 Tax=Culex pipiens TaxID=7175 RepID=A0A8D8N9W9_CULPI
MTMATTEQAMTKEGKSEDELPLPGAYEKQQQRALLPGEFHTQPRQSECESERGALKCVCVNETGFGRASGTGRHHTHRTRVEGKWRDFVGRIISSPKRVGNRKHEGSARAANRDGGGRRRRGR